jgi:hypothetical protein
VVRGDELSERFALGFERMDLKGEYGRTVVVGAHLPLRKT